MRDRSVTFERYGMEGSKQMAEDRERGAARSPEEQAPAATQQGQSPFLRQMRRVERQGVPEPGAVNPGPPPKPVRSGTFRADQTPNAEQGEEQ
jgi:hypothetical protein